MTSQGFASRLLRAELSTLDGDARTPFSGVVLFVDLVESTSMTDLVASSRPDGAERLGTALSGYFSSVIAEIAALGGDVVAIEGDAVIALWRDDGGSTAPHLQAARAALRLRESAHAWPLEPEAPMRRRLTLAAGEFTTVMLAGAGRRSFFVLVGEPLLSVGAISHHGQPGDVILDAVMAKRLGRSAVLAPVEGSEADATPVYRLDALFTDAQPPAPAPPMSDPAAALEPFVPRVVAVRSGAGLEAWMMEFRVVSVVFAQIGDAQAPDAAGALQLRARYEAVAKAADALDVEIFGVFAGDKGLLALVACGLPPFGLESNAARAAAIGERIRVEFAALQAPCHIGVATGRVFCGVVGNATRREYVLIGPVMNYGARLMQAAEDEVLCDGDTTQASLRRFTFSPARALALKGRAEPLVVHRLIAAQAAPGASEALRGAVFGREAQLRDLADGLHKAVQGQSGLLILEGEPGAGKSHLLQEAERKARALGCWVIETATDAIERATAYFAFRALVRQLLRDVGEAEEPPASVMRERLRAALAGTDLEQKAALIDDVAPIGIESSVLASQIRGAARQAGITDIVVVLAVRRPAGRALALLIDDLHWIDALSADLLLALAQRVPGLLIVATSRPRDTHEAPHAAHVIDAASRHIAVPRIESEATAQMLREMLGATTIPRRLTEFVHGQSEGLPIHVEQLGLALLQRGAVEVENGRCRIVAPDLETSAAPSRLRDVVVDRIDKLAPTDQLAAKVASVIGRAFAIEDLQAIFPVAIAGDDLREIVRRLERGGLLAPIAGGEGRTHAFRHVIIQEATYELLSYAQRRQIHRQLVDLIERRHATALQPHYAELAHHCEHAGETERAVTFQTLAARLMLRRYANEDALMHVDRAERLAREAQLPLSVARRAEMALLRGEALHELAQFPEAGAQFTDCLRLSGVRRPTGAAGIGLSLLGEAARQLAHRLGLVAAPRDAEARARAKLAAHLNTRLSEHAYFMSNSLELAYDVLAALNNAERIGSVGEMVESYGALAIGLGMSGLHGLARFYRRRSLETATTAGALRDQGFAALFAGVYSQPACDWPEAERHLYDGAAIFAQLGDRFRRQSCESLAAYVHIARAEFVRARAALDAFGPDAEAADNASVRTWVLVALSTLDQIEGVEPKAALRRLELARDVNLHRTERLLCDGMIAAARLRLGDEDGAQRTAELALRNMQETVCTMGAAWLSVSAVADVYLTLLERALAQGAPSAALFARAREISRAAHIYARGTRICQPRALAIEARRVLLEGRRARAASLFRRAAKTAQRLALPLDEALCDLGLASALDGEEARTQREGALRRLRALGARPWGGEAAPPFQAVGQPDGALAP